MEILPNELLIQCLKYLNIFDIFHSFDRLNSRFSSLIRTIPICVNFRHVSKSKFDEFCTILSWKHVYSLQLSNENFCQIYLFISKFHLNELPHLQYLTLIEVRKHNLVQLKSILPLLTQLSCFRLIDSLDNTKEILSILPTSHLRTLTVSQMYFLCNISSIVNLTLSSCQINEFLRILNMISNLKYFKIDHLTGIPLTVTKEEIDSMKRHSAVYLKELNIQNLYADFDDLFVVLRQTPNLQSLTVISSRSELIDAKQWENLISSSIPNLYEFKFSFKPWYLDDGEKMYEKFQEFQSDFWQRERHWLTEYFFTNDWAWIYTLPCILQSYALREDAEMNSNHEPIHDRPIFDGITKLTVSLDEVMGKSNFYFPNIKALTIKHHLFFGEKCCLTKTDLDYLKNSIDLSNIEHVSFKCNFTSETQRILSEIIKQMSRLLSLIIDPKILMSFFDNDDLCSYLNQKIKRLEFHYTPMSVSNHTDQWDKFCQVFSNLEQLTCLDRDKDYLEFLLERLPHLSRVNFKFGNEISNWPALWFEQQEKKLGVKILHDAEKHGNVEYSLWIIRDNITHK